MHKQNFDTLSEAVNFLTQNGFDDGFKADKELIVGSKSSKNYAPDELKIVETYRFEGMSNPQDSTVVFAIEASDGNKGTLVMSYSSEHSQNFELIKKIPKA